MWALFSAIFRLSGCGSTAINASSQKQWVLLDSLLETCKEKRVQRCKRLARCKRSRGKGRKSLRLPTQKRRLSLSFSCWKTNKRFWNGKCTQRLKRIEKEERLLSPPKIRPLSFHLLNNQSRQARAFNFLHLKQNGPRFCLQHWEK